MMSITRFWRSLSFATRLTSSIILLILVAILVLTSLLFKQYHQAQMQANLAELATQSDSNAQSFTAWLLARQDEIRFLAGIDAALDEDHTHITSLMASLTELNGFYDTIYLVDTDGHGIAGVSFEQKKARILSDDEAYEFVVSDRDWFRTALAGKQTFSQPVVSRATGNSVSTIAVPIIKNNQVIAVVRGAVKIDTLIERIAHLPRENATEIYLVEHQQGLAITPSPSIQNLKQTLTTQAVEAIRQQQDFVGNYTSPANRLVIGSATYIPLLGWGLVVEQDEQVAMAEVNKTLLTIVGIAAIIIVISIFICLLMVRAVTRTLGGDPSYAAQVVHQVAEGNLNTKIILEDDDQTSLLAAINIMQKNLRNMLSDISSYSEQVAAASTQLAQINEQTAQNIERQAREISNSAAAMNEMSTSLEEVARNTQHTAGASASAHQAANNGHKALQTTIEAIKSLALQVTHATVIINEVKGDSDRIGSVLQVIESIAEQTNLLALNAAIEAARAGDSGRGFAVVADEVRGLASRTKDSTTEIQSTIEKLQSASEGAVKAMDVSTKGTEASVTLAGNTGQTLEEIIHAIELIDNTAQQIASATEQQTMVAREINESIHNISSVADETAEHVKQSSAASESLAYLATQLKSLVAQFRI